MIRNFEVLRSVIERVGSVRRGRGEGGARAGRLFLLAHEEGLSFKPKYWANLFKCIFFVLFFCLLFFALPWLDQLAVLFLHYFFIRAFSPLPFFRKLFKKFLRGDFLQPPYFKTCSAEKQLIFNYRKLSFEGAVSRLSSSFCLGQTVRLNSFQKP